MNRQNSALTARSLWRWLLAGGLSGLFQRTGAAGACCARNREQRFGDCGATSRRYPIWLEAVGTVRAAQTSQVASQMMGNIVEIRAHEGDRVQSGQVLAIIDDAQPRAAWSRPLLP